MARILIITNKQPSSNPRMRKSADALAGAGHEVRVLYMYNGEWAAHADKEIFEQAQWSWKMIGGDPIHRPLEYFWSRLLRKGFEWIGHQTRAQFRSFNRFIREAKRWNPDLVIGHNPGSLAPLVAIGEKLGIPTIFDAEDFHRGESYWVREQQESIIEGLENRFFPKVHAITAASPLISETYRTLFPNQSFTTVDNAFSRSTMGPIPEPKQGPLKIVWFSQVLGLDRGLQEFLAGMSLAFDIPIELSLIGLHDSNLELEFQGNLTSTKHSIHFHQPLKETTLFEVLRAQEIGLALEFPTPKNRDICRTNKLFTYPLAGCFMLLSRTASQEQFLSEWPMTGRLIDLPSPQSIAEAIEWAYQHRDDLLEKRKSSWEVAKTQLNWEVESTKLIELVQKVLKS